MNTAPVLSRRAESRELSVSAPGSLRWQGDGSVLPTPAGPVLQRPFSRPGSQVPRDRQRDFVCIFSAWILLALFLF